MSSSPLASSDLEEIVANRSQISAELDARLNVFGSVGRPRVRHNPAERDDPAVRDDPIPAIFDEGSPVRSSPPPVPSTSARGNRKSKQSEAIESPLPARRSDRQQQHAQSTTFTLPIRSSSSLDVLEQSPSAPPPQQPAPDRVRFDAVKLLECSTKELADMGSRLSLAQMDGARQFWENVAAGDRPAFERWFDFNRKDCVRGRFIGRRDMAWRKDAMGASIVGGEACPSCVEQGRPCIMMHQAHTPVILSLALGQFSYFYQ